MVLCDCLRWVVRWCRIWLLIIFGHLIAFEVKPVINLLMVAQRPLIIVEVKVKSPLATSEGRPQIPPLAEWAPFVATAPDMRTELHTRYRQDIRSGHRVVLALHETFGGMYADARDLHKQCSVSHTRLRRPPHSDASEY